MSLADVARTVGVTAPAVYRHFRNKDALLAAAIASGLDTVDAAFDEAEAPLESLLFNLAGAALDRRDLWILLQRELRNLEGDERAKLQTRFDEFVSRFSTRVGATRPELERGELTLIVTAVLATLASPSVGPLRMPRAEYQRCLAAAAAAAAGTVLPDAAQGVQPAIGWQEAADGRPPRSEQLLETAIGLFHQHGYAAVSLDEIGAAVGLAGPSIYHHFVTKSELLVTAFTRAAQWLATSHDRGHVSVDDLVRSYIQLGVQQRQLFGVYVTEAINLPPRARSRINAELTANVDEWATALRLRRPDLGIPTSCVLVYAARGIVNDVVRIGHLHRRQHIAGELESLLHAVLDAGTAEMPLVDRSG